MNIFLKPEIAQHYDEYYQTEFGKKIDRIEKEIISALLRNISRKEMLELGCGTGHWTHYFTQQGFDVTAIDNSEEMLKIAKNKRINAKFLNVNSQKLPFENESFNTVSSITMLEFVDNQEAVIKEVYRVLKKDGWLILGCLNANSIIGKNKEKDETFKNANLVTVESLKSKLRIFNNEIVFKVGVHTKPNYEIVDNNDDTTGVEPVFIGTLIQKRA